MELNLATPPPLRLDISGAAQHEAWKKFKANISLYFSAAEIKDTKRKKAVLLYIGGEDLRTIYDTLADTGDTYATAIAELGQYFDTGVNLSVEQNKFRSINQEPSESIKTFVTRLREAAASCKFDEYSTDEACIDQIIEKTISTKLRRKLLTEESLTIERVLKLGCVMESTEQQARSIEKMSLKTLMQ